MLRIASILLVLSAGIISAAPVPKIKVKDEDAVLGKWKLVEVTHDGQPVAEVLRDAVATFDSKTLWIKCVTDSKRDSAMTYTLDPEKKHIELHAQNPGRNPKPGGVYELDGDTLILAIGMGENAQRPKEAKPGIGIAYIKLQRVKEEKK